MATKKKMKQLDEKKGLGVRLKPGVAQQLGLRRRVEPVTKVNIPQFLPDIRLSTDQLLDASSALTSYVRLGRYERKELAPEVVEFVDGITKAKKQADVVRFLNVLNSKIVDVNRMEHLKPRIEVRKK